MTATFTHTFRETGCGFPGIGDIVLHSDCGDITSLRVVDRGSILTGNPGSGAANHCHLTCEVTSDWDDLTEDDQDAAFPSNGMPGYWPNGDMVHHVTAIESSDE